MAASSRNDLFLRALRLEKWLEQAEDCLSPYLEKKVLIVSLVGKDSLTRSKGEDLNDLLRMDVFPRWTDSEDTMSIQAYFCLDNNAIFLVMNGYSDFTHLQKVFASNQDKNFFEKMAESEEMQVRLLHFLCIFSHLIVFVESSTRFDISLSDTLSNVNKIRKNVRESVSEKLEEISNEATEWIREGRLALPRILFAFQRNIIRNELGYVKKREICDKLEHNLESQIYSILKCYRLVEQSSGDSLGYVPENDAFVSVMQPVLVNVNPLSDILQIALGKEIAEDGDDKAEKTPTFTRFLRSHIDSLRSSKSKIYEIPKLELWVKYARALLDLIKPDSEMLTRKLLNQYVNRQLQFMKMINAKHIKEAIARYTGTSTFGKGKAIADRNRSQVVFTKAEHDEKVAMAIAYLDAVLIGDREEAVAQVRSACDNLWQGGMRGCEQVSMTGNRCQLKVHPTVGDASVDPSAWEMHSNDITYLSTCSCGRRQAVRRDPFTLKEANYDFYFENKVFTCCAGLEKHVFAVLEDDDTDAEKGLWEANDNWDEGEGGGSNPLFPVSAAMSRDRHHSDGENRAAEVDEEEGTGSDTGEDTVSNAEPEPIESSSQSSQDDDVHYRNTRSYLDDEAVSFVKNPHTKLDEAAIAFEARLKKLRAKKIPFLEGVPHSLSPALPPLFPSWTLTCIGPNNYYTHSYGLRDQPNLKLGGEYLYPVTVQLEVDPVIWDRDMQYVQAVEGVSSRAPPRKARRLPAEIEKVKLFVGMEYECPRGHRFFVAENGEPLRLPKNSNARTAMSRESDDQFLRCDFPLRRQCTCRKLPVQTAQLMRVHVVTPKAPITVTIQPVVELPGQEGHFGTGEAPLQLSWARYYILQLPFIYSGPAGVWIPPVGVERVGTFKGNAIQVKYVPMLSRR
uniref:Nonsense-mediated mRNA decay factor SMG8 n=1 Tax=Haemonchus contortus TaxID=6289 RepID=A0A7I4YA45_HAECO